MLKKILTPALLLAGLLAPTAVQAQEAGMPQVPKLPLDTAVVTGTLPNGLTYIVRHNNYPKGQADFFIAQKVGSILEEDNQRGLAHFLEHMAFNGTKNFPDNNLREWLATKGVMFGRDLNAYTSFDETVYNISSVPVAGNTNVVDSCLLILHDWATDLTLADDAINDERGVIEQEWRRRSEGQFRIMENTFPTFFPDSARYGNRLPIGTMEVVLNFKPDELRDYYHRWYRPDQQAIIVVGDVDVNRTVEQIKSIFGPIEMPANAPERRYYTWGDSKGTKVSIGTDPEQSYSVGLLMLAGDPLPKELRGTMAEFVQDYVEDMIASMFNQRMTDIASKPDAPFMQASLDFGPFFGFVATKDAVQLAVVGKNGDISNALEAAYRELRRAVTGGFTQSELERAKAEWLSAREKAANNRDTHPSTQYAREYVDYFNKGTYIPGPQKEYELGQMVAAMVNVDQINQVMAQLNGPDDRFLWLALPQKEDSEVPTEEGLLAMMAAVDGEEIEAYSEEVRTDPLIATPPTPGKIVAVKALPEVDALEWTLSNGAKVVVKSTKFKEDEILFKSRAKGGIAGYAALSPESAIVLPYELENLSGGTYSATDMSKYFAGKNFRMVPYYEDYYRGFNGNTTVKDLPSMLEAFYAKYTTPNLDADEFAATAAQFTSLLSNMEKNPQMAFSRELLKALYESPRKQMLSAEAFAKADRGEILTMVQQMNRNAADYTFYFVGNVDPETLRPLVETYLASLPAEESTVAAEVVYDPAYGVTAGTGRADSKMAMETPQVYTAVMISDQQPFTMKNRVLANLARQIVTKRLVDVVREKMGAVYSISAMITIDRTENPNTVLQVQTPMKPELAEQALVAIDSVLSEVAKGVNPDELKQAKEILVKDIKEESVTNSRWLGTLDGIGIDGVDALDGSIEAAEAATPAEVQAYLQRLLDAGNKRTVVLSPAE
ncbi:MAG: insulinase family protein [Candidatus Amulumruptor caecigallinarius]|nr:insulinase family protein [Candidatus Amulumruptor caecigallinarius]MCM1397647.1 insulinase family protein [Candidatus Amulumruptor caecigallinarius]MCM1454673.1 insulinase family protein [bacterium]